MALGLKFTDGTNLLFDCSTTSRYIAAEDGWQRGQATEDEKVADTFVLMVQDTAANIQKAASDINRILEQGKIYDEQKIGDQIFLEGTLDGTNWRRSPVVGGMVTGYDLDSTIRSGFAEIHFQVLRKDYFDGVETNVPLTNQNGSNVTSGLRIYNCNDGATVDTTYKRNNYVEIAAASVLGDLPAPVKLTISSTSGFTHLYIGLGWANSQVVNRLYEAETAAGSGTSYSGASGGQYYSGAGELNLAASGGPSIFYLPMLRGRLNNDNAKVTYWINNGQIKVSYLTQTTQQATDWQLFPLQMLRAPTEYGTGATLHWQYAASQDTDYIQLLPANFWRIAIHTITDPASGEFIENGYTERAAFMYSGTDQPTLVYGTGIFLMPNKLQRIWILRQNLVSTETNSSNINARSTITLTYRPRYRSL